MKKKLVLRKWVEVVLGIIGWMMFLIVCSECDDMKLFVISHIGAGLILLLIMYIYVKFGRNSE